MNWQSKITICSFISAINKPLQLGLSFFEEEEKEELSMECQNESFVKESTKPIDNDSDIRKNPVKVNADMDQLPSLITINELCAKKRI